MQNNKKIYVAIALTAIIIMCGIFIWLMITNVSQTQITVDKDLSNAATDENVKCAKQGEPIGAMGMPEKCCPGLKPLGGIGKRENCDIPAPPGGLSVCSECGNDICESDIENKCNCPEDCADMTNPN